MRITHIMLSKGRGGAERILIDVVRGLAEEGEQVQVVIDARLVDKALLYGHSNLSVVEIKAFNYVDLLAYHHLYRQVRAFSPDLIHCHLSRAAFMGGRVAKKLSIPALVTTHNNIKLKYCRNINHYQVLTEAQSDYLLSCGVAADAISKIPNFSNMPAVDELPKQAGHRFVAYGRMMLKKGYPDLIRAFSLVLQQQPDAELLLGGDGPERGTIETLIRELGLQHKVTLCGWVEDVAGFLAKGDYFVLPSRDEPFGIVLLEVMARGVPIISTRTSGALEILDEHCAYLANIEEPASLAAAMLQAVTEGTARGRADNALQRYKLQYRKEAVIPRMRQLYQQLLG